MDSNTLVTGSKDKTARIWNVTTSTCVAVLRGHTNMTRGVCVSPEGDAVCTGSLDNTLRIYRSGVTEAPGAAVKPSSRGWKMVHKLTCPGDSVTCAAWSRDGLHVATGGGDSTARVWVAETGALLKTLKGHNKR